MTSDSTTKPVPEEEALFRHHLNSQTGKLTWQELERHFARGVVLCIDNKLDLIDVAMAMHKDNKTNIETWKISGQLHNATMEDAKNWHLHDPLFWGIVISPWVLIQEIA